MQKTSIEWVKNPDGTQGYTWNPITGCLNHVNEMCKGGGFPCYAYRLANGRLRERYLANANIAPIGTMIIGAAMGEKALRDPFYPRFWPERLNQLGDAWDRRTWHKTVKGIFVCDMSDLFGISIPEEWTRQVLNELSDTPHRYYLLTKQPQNLIKFSPFPPNCWVGATATNAYYLSEASYRLSLIEAKVKYISLEPLLGQAITDWEMNMGALRTAGITWLIIGACTGTRDEIKQLIYRYPELTPMPVDFNMRRWTAQPRIEWVQEIVRAADKAGIPVFLKNNLKSLFRGNEPNWLVGWENKPGELRQEIPK